MLAYIYTQEPKYIIKTFYASTHTQTTFIITFTYGLLSSLLGF